MITYPIYKGIKQRLNSVAPCFYYLGQYLTGKDNTSYKVPAIYIEMPKNLSTTFYPGKIKAAKGAQVKIHLVCNAPYKNHDNTIQDSAIASHENMLNDIDKLMTGWVLKGTDQKLLTQQFIPIGANIGNFSGMHIFSVLTYTTELYSRILQ
jgi:hypothetical protein